MSNIVVNFTSHGTSLRVRFLQRYDLRMVKSQINHGMKNKYFFLIYVILACNYNIYWINYITLPAEEIIINKMACDCNVSNHAIVNYHQRLFCISLLLCI